MNVGGEAEQKTLIKCTHPDASKSVNFVKKTFGCIYGAK
jgi:hypothetical protein